MKDFDSARQVAEKLNAVFHAFYKNVYIDHFDSDLDFSNIPSTTLKDFLIYTAGFIGFKNNEELDELLSPVEIQKMLTGRFTIKYLTDKQLEIIAKKNGVTFEDGDQPQTIKLYSIQDGTYYINKNVYDPVKEETSNFISLTTSPVELHTNTLYTSYDPKLVIKTLRDTFAHESPYINGNRLSFLNFSNPEDMIVVSKMWLRGYTELFARKSMPFTASEMADALQEVLRDTNNTLSSNQEIDSALDGIKNIFSESQQQKFYTYKFLLKERLSAYSNFSKKDLKSKISTIAGITCNCPNIFDTSKGSSSSQILYTLENLVGIELEKRNEEAPLDESDPEVVEFAKILEEISNLKKGLKIIESLKSMQGKNGKTYKRNVEKIQGLTEKANHQITLINPKKKLETTHMDLLAFENLENLPVDVAVNIVYLMAFNNLVSSGFYEQVLRYTTFKELNPTQSEFFNNFNFGKIGYSQKRTGDRHYSADYNPSEKAFILYSMRNALCHGNLTYSIPKQKEGVDISYKNIILYFNAEKQGISIRGRLKDFYTLLSSPQFTQERDEALITTYDSQRIKESERRRKQWKRPAINSKNDDDSEPGQN